jgi:Family of unknown function (DUF5677)
MSVRFIDCGTAGISIVSTNQCQKERPESVSNEVLLKSCVSLHETAGPFVRRVSEGFVFPRPLRDVVWRSALRKDYEIFGAILDLVGKKQSGIALALLRPICEDLLYLVYVGKLALEDANIIIKLRAEQEICESLLAQSFGDGNGAWEYIGLPGRSPVEERLKKIKDALAEEGRKLGWRQGSSWPSTAHVATTTGFQIIYDVVYHGTSRGVHFSPHHLLRMVWGELGGDHSARLENFERYYETYTLNNVGWIFGTLIAQCWTMGDEDPGDELNGRVAELFETLCDCGRVPIVTYDEFMYDPEMIIKYALSLTAKKKEAVPMGV